MKTQEQIRLEENREHKLSWKKWGPYLSERQWGTVREDYSENRDAWNYFTHGQARSRAYRWGEDGLGGISDDRQRVCFALALWNGNDPILKERLFGLNNSEGNHGEDVKEYYFYLDSTPTHSYMKYLYKYPQAAYPYNDLIVTNRERGRGQNEANLRRVLKVMLDENEFLSPFGIRALSRVYQNHPYIYRVGDQEYRVSYLPGDSNDGMFGGNSNWRGPIWMPVNMLILRALLQYYLYYGNSFTIECPTGSGQQMNLYEVAEELGRRLTSIFLKDEQGTRPVHGTSRKFQEDPHWRDYPLFYEYFHGDTGAGVGASHQTGWTGAIARIMRLFAVAEAEQVLEQGKGEAAGTVGDRPER